MKTVWRMLVRGAVISTIVLPVLVVCFDGIFIDPTPAPRGALLMIFWAIGVLWFGAAHYAEFGQ